MRFLHISDLHLGRTLGEFSLEAEQHHFLNWVLDLVRENHVEACLIAGDVYNRSLPTAEAVTMLNDFLSGLKRLGVPALVVAGNHDSGPRLDFLQGVLRESGIYLRGEYRLQEEPVTLRDALGEVDFFLLPYFRPGAIRVQLPEEAIETLDEAVAAAVRAMPIRAGVRSVLIAHQFVAAKGGEPLQSDSEAVFIGGTERVDAAHFDAFHYVALGHLHRCQQVGSGRVRYAGAPLKYALGECGQEKSVLLVTLDGQGQAEVKPVPVPPLRDLKRLRGTLAELLALPASEDFILAELTDPAPLADVMVRLRERFPYTVHVRWVSEQLCEESLPLESGPAGDPAEVFETFYQWLNGREMSAREEALLRAALAKARGEANA